MPELRQNDLPCVRQVCRKSDKSAESQAKVATRPTEAARECSILALIRVSVIKCSSWVAFFGAFLHPHTSADSKERKETPHVPF